MLSARLSSIVSSRIFKNEKTEAQTSEEFSQQKVVQKLATGCITPSTIMATNLNIFVIALDYW